VGAGRDLRDGAGVVGWGSVGGAEWGGAHLLALRFTLRAAFGWLPPFGRFAER